MAQRFRESRYFPCMFIFSLVDKLRRCRPVSRSTTNENFDNYLFNDYLIKGSKGAAVHQCLHEFRNIIEKLEVSLEERMSSITKDDLFTAFADFFNTQAYVFKTCDELFFKVSVITSKFQSLLIANGCQLSKIKCELDILLEHIRKFLPSITPIRAWPQIFTMKHALGVQNILHVVEIGIALPIGNTESERVFSFLWHVFSKECQSLSNDTMLDNLHLRCDTNYDPQHYERAIELFLSKYPSGNIPKLPCRLDGHLPVARPRKQKSALTKSLQQAVNEAVESSTSSLSDEEEGNTEHCHPRCETNLEDISDDESLWSDSDSSNNKNFIEH